MFLDIVTCMGLKLGFFYSSLIVKHVHVKMLLLVSALIKKLKMFHGKTSL